MPVVINEFEVVAEPQPKKSEADKAPAAPAPSPAPTPHDVACIVRHYKQRLARVRAD